MSSKPACEGCGQEMKLVKSGKAKVYPFHRIRRYWCQLCDYTKTIYADGLRDEIFKPAYAKSEVKKMYKQEEEARENNVIDLQQVKEQPENNT